MRAYRHWDAQWAGEFELLGRIRIQPLTYYKQEFHQPGIQDERENVRNVVQRAPIISGRGRFTAQDRNALANLGIYPGSSENVKVIGARANWFGETIYVVCLTARSDPGAFMYDAITPIADVPRFAHALLQEARGLFRQMAFGRVIYAAAPHFAEDGPVPRPNPFSKYPEFADQQEIRIALWPSERLDGPVYLESPALYEATLACQ